MCFCHVSYNPKISPKGMRKGILEKRNFKKSGVFTLKEAKLMFIGPCIILMVE